MGQSFKDHLRDNRLYLGLVSLAILFGLVVRLNSPKGKYVTSFAHERNDQLDNVFAWITKLGEEPVYLFGLILFLFVRFKDALTIPLLGFYATITSNGLKAIFQQPRPGHYYWLEVDKEVLFPAASVEHYIALNSFPSGHTISAFLFWGFFALTFRKPLLTIIFFLFAVGTGFSRIVLFQHFLEDVVAGAFFGTLSIVVIVWLSNKLSADPNKWYNRSLLNLKPRA